MTAGRTNPTTIVNTTFCSLLNLVTASMAFSNNSSRIYFYSPHFSFNGARFCEGDGDPYDLEIPQFNFQRLSCIFSRTKLFETLSS